MDEGGEERGWRGMWTIVYLRRLILDIIVLFIYGNAFVSNIMKIDPAYSREKI